MKLKNKNGVEVEFSSLGARIISILTPDRNNHYADVVQGFDTEEEYATKGKAQGAICGRVANRISNARFQIDGVTYQLEKNADPHCLHSGNHQLRMARFDVNKEGDKIVFTYFSPHLEAGFPGNVNFTIIYELSDENELIINIKAVTDQKTPLNVTSHPYFNLKGEGNGLIDDHLIQILASKFTETDNEYIPTGNFPEVENTPFDFRELKIIKNSLHANHPQVQNVGGIDHSFVLDNYELGKLKLDAIVKDENSGRVLKVFSTYPAIQFYTTNSATITGKGGKNYETHSALCLEPQFYPDSVNNPDFPNTILHPGEVYDHTIIYQFLTEK